MSPSLNRRGFLKRSLIASTGAALGLSLEEKALLAETEQKTQSQQNSSIKDMPMGKIGKLKISRLVCGGNLISGFAHSRDLIYVSSLLKNYFTDEKVMETFQICEENGINTAILRLDDQCIRILKKYWKERGGKLQWIAQVKPKENDLTTETQRAVDNGALGVYIQGGVADDFAKEGHVDLLAHALEFIKANEVIAGLGAHSLETLKECKKVGMEPDFYMKTLHKGNYWSANPDGAKTPFDLPPHDNMWSLNPEKTIEFMKQEEKPWIAFKVLAAGAIYPQEGFKYAFENGADFICVGMFDFQVAKDAVTAKDILKNLKRERPWRG